MFPKNQKQGNAQRKNKGMRKGMSPAAGLGREYSSSLKAPLPSRTREVVWLVVGSRHITKRRGSRIERARANLRALESYLMVVNGSRV